MISYAQDSPNPESVGNFESLIADKQGQINAIKDAQNSRAQQTQHHQQKYNDAATYRVDELAQRQAELADLSAKRESLIQKYGNNYYTALSRAPKNLTEIGANTGDHLPPPLPGSTPNGIKYSEPNSITGGGITTSTGTKAGVFFGNAPLPNFSNQNGHQQYIGNTPSNTPLNTFPSSSNNPSGIDLFNPSNRAAIQNNIKEGYYGNAGDIFSGKINPQFSTTYGYSTDEGTIPLFFTTTTQKANNQPSVSSPKGFLDTTPQELFGVSNDFPKTPAALIEQGYFKLGSQLSDVGEYFSDQSKLASPNSLRSSADTIIGGIADYGAIGAQTVRGTIITANNAPRVVAGLATGAVFGVAESGVSSLFGKGSAEAIGVSGAGKLLGVGYGALTIANIGEQLPLAHNQNERFQVVGNNLGGGVVDVATFGLGHDAIKIAVGDIPLVTKNTASQIKVQNLFGGDEPFFKQIRNDNGNPSTISLTSPLTSDNLPDLGTQKVNPFENGLFSDRSGQIGGRSASERSGKMSKTELSQRKSQQIQPFKVTPSSTPSFNDLSLYDVSGKGVNRLINKGIIVPTTIGVKNVHLSGQLEGENIKFSRVNNVFPITFKGRSDNVPFSISTASFPQQIFSVSNDVSGTSSRLRKNQPAIDLFTQGENKIIQQQNTQKVKNFFNNFGNKEFITSTNNNQGLRVISAEPRSNDRHYTNTYATVGPGEEAIMKGSNGGPIYNNPQQRYNKKNINQEPQYFSNYGRPNKGIPGAGSPQNRYQQSLDRLKIAVINRASQIKAQLPVINEKKSTTITHNPFSSTTSLGQSSFQNINQLTNHEPINDVRQQNRLDNDITNKQQQNYDLNHAFSSHQDFSSSTIPQQQHKQDFTFDQPQKYDITPITIIPTSPLPKSPKTPEPITPNTIVPPTPILPNNHTPSPPIIPFSITPPEPSPKIPPFKISGFAKFGGPGGVGRGRGQSFHYAPSFTALALNIHGKQPSGRLTGFEVRPLAPVGKGFSEHKHRRVSL